MVGDPARGWGCRTRMCVIDSQEPKYGTKCNWNKDIGSKLKKACYSL